MQPLIVVVDLPGIDPIAGVRHRQEPWGVEAFLAQSIVERLDEGARHVPRTMYGWLPHDKGDGDLHG